MHEPVAPSPDKAAGDDEPRENPDMIPRNLAPVLSTVSAAALVIGLGAAAQPALAQNAAANAAATAIPQGTGYFATDSKLPFLAPDFTKISEDDYIPAFEQGMAIQKAEVAAIIANPNKPTFANTIVALETSGRMLGRVGRVFYTLTGASTTERLDTIDTEISPKLSAHSDSITLNPALFARVKAVYDARESLGLSLEEGRLLEETYKDMVHAGALLTEAEREQVKAINGQLSTLATEFGQKVRAATNAQPLVVNTAAELAGLSEADIKAAADLAAEKGMPGKYAIALQNTTQQPLLPNLENRATREALAPSARL